MTAVTVPSTAHDIGRCMPGNRRFDDARRSPGVRKTSWRCWRRPTTTNAAMPMARTNKTTLSTRSSTMAEVVSGSAHAYSGGISRFTEVTASMTAK
jgi:hypothetical protein